MSLEITDIPQNSFREAVSIFTEAFADDPLFVYAFPEELTRVKMTEIMYEFVVYDMVPKLNLTLKGVYAENKLAGCIIYSTLQSRGWSGDMNDSIERMRSKANDKRIGIIGEYAMLSGFKPNGEYIYGNELAVKKSCRGKGFGKALLKDLISYSENETGSNGILIDTANKDNIGLYNKFGWELKMTVPFYDMNKYFLWRENR